MPLIRISEDELSIFAQILEEELEAADRELEAIRNKYNDAVYQRLIDTASFYAQRRTLLASGLKELRKEAK